MTLHHLDAVASTNDVAREAALKGAPSGSIYRAERQTSGRGRHGNTWLSLPGNLMMSVVLRPNLPPEDLPALALAAGVASREVLARFGLDTRLKWPNDLMIGERKLGGILVEGVFEGGKLASCVVGIGINVALDVDALDEPLRETATSFRHLGLPQPDLDALAEALAVRLAYWESELLGGHKAHLFTEWKAHAAMLGEEVEFERNGQTRRARALDLDERGGLVVLEASGAQYSVDSGQVRTVRSIAGGQSGTRTWADTTRPPTRAAARASDLLLVIDVGNTNTVLGVFHGDELGEHWRTGTYRDRTADEHGMALMQLLALGGLTREQIGHVIISCVVPPVTSCLEEAIERFFHVRCLVVGPGIKTGMPILYEPPRDVGADRVVNAVAAYDRHQAGLIVVDFGTATTFDAVSPQGEYLGGAIAPGMAISADALFIRAAMLPRVDLSRPARVVGRNTIASMQSGLLFGYVGLVNEIVRRMKHELKFPTRVFATGGLARLVASEADVIDEIDEYLTLHGLRIIFERNREPARAG